MAANVLTEVIPKILAQGLLALRENAIMAQLVNSDYEIDAKQKGDTVNVPIPSAIAVQSVSNSYIPPDDAGFTPTSVALQLNTWEEAPFFMSDKDIVEAMDGTIPMQASEAIKALGNKVDADILALYDTVYGFSGSPGVTPFATSVKEATESRKVLNNQLCSLTDRRFVIDPDAEANALGLRAFQDFNFTGSFDDIKAGKLSPKLGFNWFMDQNIPSHTRGAANAAYVVNGVNALGVTTLVTKTGAGLGSKGDIFTIAGDSQTYVLTADMALVTAMAISPGLKVATSGDEAITFKGVIASVYPQNLAFHRDAFAFASRPLVDQVEGLGSIMQSMTDPISGISLRFSVSRQYYRTRYAYDILYGCVLVRPQLACRLWG